MGIDYIYCIEGYLESKLIFGFGKMVCEILYVIEFFV